MSAAYPDIPAEGARFLRSKTAHCSNASQVSKAVSPACKAERTRDSLSEYPKPCGFDWRRLVTVASDPVFPSLKRRVCPHRYILRARRTICDRFESRKVCILYPSSPTSCAFAVRAATWLVGSILRDLRARDGDQKSPYRRVLTKSVRGPDNSRAFRCFVRRVTAAFRRKWAEAVEVAADEPGPLRSVYEGPINACQRGVENSSLTSC